MFRLFRRGKKDKKKEKTVERKVEPETDVTPQPPQPSEISEHTQTDSQTQQIEEFTTSETPFEEKFATIPKIITEPIPEEPETVAPILTFLPFTETIIENEITINSFISPELLKSQPIIEQSSLDSTTTGLASTELIPISLEERIEGAMFSIGRPIHTSELIESLQEESPLVKRTLRKVARRRKRKSPIVIEEISKDRWVLQLNPIYHEFFQSISPQLFMTPEERRILTEISYRQPISLGMLKKIVRKIGPVKITEICKLLESKDYITGEKRARSMVYTSTSKFAHDFGFDDESRRLKLQMLWRLKRLMGDYEVEEEEEIEEQQMEETSEEGEPEPEAEAEAEEVEEEEEIEEQQMEETSEEGEPEPEAEAEAEAEEVEEEEEIEEQQMEETSEEGEPEPEPEAEEVEEKEEIEEQQIEETSEEGE